MDDAASKQATDSAFLDDVFDALTTAITEGRDVDHHQLAGDRAHLLADIEEMHRIAIDVSVVLPADRPSIPGYEIVRELGRGGMGSVHLARQDSLGGRLVALKIMPHGLALSARARIRFQNEALALARLRHPGVVEIFDVLPDHALPSYSMEWIEGCTLLTVCDRVAASGHAATTAEIERLLETEIDDKSTLDVFARWGAEIARALAAVHRQGLLHRDIKPSNIMIRLDGTPVLTDFGLARDLEQDGNTRTGSFLGTPAYAAPEQLRAAELDERSDIYSLGATLYHAVTGRVAHSGHDNLGVLQRMEAGLFLSVRKLNPGVPKDLATIVETAMQTDPGRRYASADALADDLERFLRREPIRARPIGLLARTAKFTRRNRRAFVASAVGGVVALALSIGVGAYWIHRAGIPARVAAHVHEAQLTLLDPKLGERLVHLRHGGHLDASARPLAHAITSYDRALELREDRKLRVARESIAFAQAIVERKSPLPTALETLAPQAYDFGGTYARTGTFRDSAEIERLDVRAGSSARSEKFAAGLIALICGEDAMAIRLWRGLDLGREPEPFIDAALGQLYMQRDEPALAWPRLERAFLYFREVGFVGAGLADAAQRCGDARYALRLIDEVRPLPRPMPYAALDRVEADACLRVGETKRAKSIYRRMSQHPCPPMTYGSIARVFEADGDHRNALRFQWFRYTRWPETPGVVDGIRRALRRIWSDAKHAANDPGAGITREGLLAESLREHAEFLDALLLWGRRDNPSKDEQLEALVARMQLDHSKLRALRAMEPDVQLEQARYWAGGGRGLVRSAIAAIGSPGTDSDRDVGALLRRGLHVRALPGFADLDCRCPSLSADGRFVAFEGGRRAKGASLGSDEVAAVFLHDLESAQTHQISPSTGSSYLPAISPDGGYVAFYHREAAGTWICLLHDCRRRVNTVVARDVMPVGTSDGVRWRLKLAVSPDAEYVLCRVLLLEPGQARIDAREHNIAVWQRSNKQLQVLAPAHTSWLGIGFLRDGSVLATQLAWFDTGSFAFLPTSDFARFERGAAAWERRTNSAPTGLAGSSIFEGAGGGGRGLDRWLLLMTRATNLLTIDNASAFNVFAFDPMSSKCRRVNEDHRGRSCGSIWFSSPSDAGRVAFCASEDRKHYRMFIRDLEEDWLRRVDEGASADCLEIWPSFSADGKVLAYQRRALTAPGSKWQIQIATLDS